MTGRGTQCHDLADQVAIVQRLASMILEFFSSLNDSVVLYPHLTPFISIIEILYKLK